MLAGEFIKLLNCTARFIDYGKPNVLAIYEWEQSVLFKQNGKQATMLKSYKKWNHIENRIVSGKGVELDIDGCEEKISFFDVSQTSAQKYGKNQKKETDSVPKEAAVVSEMAAADNTNITDVGFTHKLRGLLLTAFWQELTIFQKTYEGLTDVKASELLCHISVVYIVHSNFISNWQNGVDVETAFNAFCGEYLSRPENAGKSVKPYLLGALFSDIYQAAVNLIVKIEKRFESLSDNSDSEAVENYYMRARFYDICDKEKVAVCRLKPGTKVDFSLSIDCFEIIETLPYKPGMEREAFLEYMQSVFDNGLTLEHLVLVRRKDKDGVTVVTTYRIDVCDWNRKPQYVNFEIVTVSEPKKYYLRPVLSEVLDMGSGGVESGGKPNQQNKPESKPETPPPKDEINKNEVESAGKTAIQSTAVPTTGNTVNQKRKKKKDGINVMEKISKLKEDIQNKTC